MILTLRNFNSPEKHNREMHLELSHFVNERVNIKLRDILGYKNKFTGELHESEENEMNRY
jgi:hypothetical protein